MLLVIAAVAAETKLLRQQQDNSTQIPLGRQQVLLGQIADQQVLIAHSGVGATAMANRLTRVLENYACSAVLLCGCAGSYPGSNLQTGDLALASEEVFADLGVACADGFLPLGALNIPHDPLLQPPLQQSYPLDTILLQQAKLLLPQAISGRFVTVNCCSGTPQLSEELQHRCAGICENMEGAAAAQVCAEYCVPLLELRGISNPTGTRDPACWDIPAGCETAQRAVLHLINHWEQVCAS